MRRRKRAREPLRSEEELRNVWEEEEKYRKWKEILDFSLLGEFLKILK